MVSKIIIYAQTIFMILCTAHDSLHCSWYSRIKPYVNITIYFICCTADFYYHHPLLVYTNSQIFIVDERAILYRSLIHCGGCEITYNNRIHKLTHKSLVTRLAVYNCYIVSRYPCHKTMFMIQTLQ